MLVVDYGDPALADFGESEICMNKRNSTIKGTPSYMSYSIRSALKVRNSTGNKPSDWSHDVEKSDVMSLGLTVIAIMLLRSPGCLNHEETYREN